MAELPEPDSYGLPAGSVVAVPAEGLTVYRLLYGRVPVAEDFRSQSPQRAAQAGTPELLRAGLSHFLTLADAERARALPASRVARIVLEPGRGIHVARTGRRPGHVTVWARPADLLACAEVAG